MTKNRKNSSQPQQTAGRTVIDILCTIVSATWGFRKKHFKLAIGGLIVLSIILCGLAFLYARSQGWVQSKSSKEDPAQPMSSQNTPEMPTDLSYTYMIQVVDRN